MGFAAEPKVKIWSGIVVALVAASFTEAAVSTTKFQVHIPSALTVASGGYDHRDALFGTFPFGGKIQQKVYYANTTLCDANEVAFGRLNSYPKSAGNTESSSLLSVWDPPFILLVDRGNCTFVAKVRNGQKAGAAAVLIADDICMCIHMDDGCELPETQETCEQQEPFMADDGSGKDISIPAFLLFKADADRIKQTLVVQNQPVVAELSFDIPNPDGRVEYDIWTSPGDPTSRPLITTFVSAATALSSHALFTPHMDIIDGVLNQCTQSAATAHSDVQEMVSVMCEGLCTNHGRYCALDPDGDRLVGASGSDVVIESLRQLCIWQEYGGNHGLGVEWWMYAGMFATDCAYDTTGSFENFANAKCIARTMQRAGIDAAKIERCMAEAGGVDDDVPNKLLEEQLVAKAKDGMIVLPTLFVNNAPIRGEFDYQNAFRAICNGFAQGTGPDICERCELCHDVEACVANEGHCKDGLSIALGDNGGGISHTTFFASILALVSCFGVVGYVLHRRQQRYMHDQIRGIMAEYMPVDPNKNVSTTLANDDDDDDDNGFAMS